MATWRIIVQKNWFNLAGSIAVSSFKEILSNLRKFYLRFKEMCEIGSESHASAAGGGYYFFKMAACFAVIRCKKFGKL